MRIGRLARRAGEEDLAGRSCRAGMVHLLSTEANISPYHFSCFGKEVVYRSAKPALMAVDVDRLEASFVGIGQAIVEGRASKLDSSGEKDQFDLVVGELSDRFGRSETLILDGDQIRYGAGPNASFSVTQTKNTC
jgi:hypothetical protein